MKSIKLPSNLGRLCISRVAEGPASTAHQCDNPEALAAYWTENVASATDYNPDQERIVVVLLNTRLRPIGWHLIALGTCNECLTGSPRSCVLRWSVAATGSRSSTITQAGT